MVMYVQNTGIRGKYTRDHFTNNMTSWHRHVVPYLKRLLAEKAGAHGPLRVLMVGSADEGLPVVFLSENAEIGRLHIDVLSERASSRLAENTTGMKGAKIHVRIGDMERSLTTMLARNGWGAYDMAFVCGEDDKDTAIVARLAVLTFMAMKPGGLMVFDNYTRSRENDSACPRRGIDAFVDSHSRLLKAVGPWGWQAMVIRRRTPLAKLGCMSEFFHEDLLKV